MKNTKKGFTLIELLIAATIIGILAVFATVAYRNSVADTRLAAAKGRLDVLAAAVQRFKLDNPGVSLGGSATISDQGLSACARDNGGFRYNVDYSPQVLISCGYLENGGWSDEYFFFQVCDGDGNMCSDQSRVNKNRILACMSGKADNKKLPAKYRYNSGNGYMYCYGETVGGQEYLGPTE